MDSKLRTALIAALLDRGVPPSVADQIRAVEGDSNAVRDLTPDKARGLLAMFSEQIRKYGSPMLRAPTPRVTPAQRPFWEYYRFKQHSGAQEMARRRKQMNSSFHGRPDLLWTKHELSGEPGVLPIPVRMHLNSHGIPCPFYS